MRGEKIPHEEKIFSIFEPYTEWIQKGKSGRSSVELGLKIAIGTDQYGFILTHRVMEKEQDVEVALPMVKKINDRYEIESVSFDKGFWSPINKEEIEQIVETVVMPKKGKLNKQESEYERSKKFKLLRKQHSAVESNINSLEYHGLNRCPDKGIKNFKKYAALGVLSYNLHILGKLLIPVSYGLEKSKSKERKKAA
jgi:IS5 family transposase